jgi:hypothetical protein
MRSFIAVRAKRFPIHLSITVGHPAMIGLGPIGGHTFETGLAIASEVRTLPSWKTLWKILG